MRKLAIILSVVITGCSQPEKMPVRQNEKDQNEKLAEFGNDDVQMNSAIDSARKTFPVFLEALKNPCADCDNYSVKMRFDFDEASGEHIWLDHLFFNKADLYGTISNEPENIEGIGFGDTIRINPEVLSDWMFVRNGKLVGGYTVKTIYRNLSSAEKRQLEEQLNAVIE